MTCFIPRGLFNQYIAGTSACIIIVASGSCYGWMTPILTHLLGPDSEIPMTTMQASWVISVIELGNLVSPLPTGILTNHIGRKPILLATAPLYIISWLMILYFPSILMLGAARVVQGIAMGLAFTVAPIYLGEISSDASRGAITSLFFNSWWLGFLIEYAVGPFLAFNNFIYFTLAINIPFLLLFFWQPESPYYYLLAGNEEKAYHSLKWFRDTPPDKLKEEIEKIKLSLEEGTKTVHVQDIIATAVDRKALSLLTVLTTVRILSGTGVLTVYATQIFDLTPNLSMSSDTVTIVLGVVMLLGGCISSFTSDTLGRRPLLLISSIGSVLCHFCTGTYYLLLFKTSLKVSKFSWIAPVSILMYSCLCTAGMYPVCSAYTSELFSSHTRGIAACLGAIIVTIFSFVALIIYQPITEFLGLYAMFYFFFLTSFIGSLFFYFCAPETKGKSFVQIRKELCEMRVLGSPLNI